MKKTLILASAIAVGVASPALAQDEAAPYDGVRIEARVGLDYPIVKIPGDSEGQTGVSYGAEVGYDLAMANFVIGAYAGIDGSSVKECTEVFGSDEACVKAGRNITAGARLGAQVGTGLFYVKGGYSNGRVTGTYTDFIVPANNGSLSGDLDGYHLGAGYEMNVSNNFYGKLEYVYTNYDTSNDFGFDVDLQRHQVLIGAGIRF